MEKWNMCIPSRRWNNENPGGDRRLRPSTLIQDRRERGEEQEILWGESGGLSSPWPHQADSTQNDAEAKKIWYITGDFIYRHHVEPRVKLYMPKEESLPILLKYIDVTRTTHTSLDVLLEKHIEDYGNSDEDREMSDASTGFTRLFGWMKGHLTDAHGPVEEGDWRGNKRPQDLTTYGQICGSICLMHQNAKRSKSGLSRNQSSIMPENYVVCSSLNLRMRTSRTSWKMLVGS